MSIRFALALVVPVLLATASVMARPQVSSSGASGTACHAPTLPSHVTAYVPPPMVPITHQSTVIQHVTPTQAPHLPRLASHGSSGCNCSVPNGRVLLPGVVPDGDDDDYTNPDGDDYGPIPAQAPPPQTPCGPPGTWTPRPGPTYTTYSYPAPPSSFGTLPHSGGGWPTGFGPPGWRAGGPVATPPSGGSTAPPSGGGSTSTPPTATSATQKAPINSRIVGGIIVNT